MLEDQTMWVEKQHEHLSLIQERRDTEQKIRKRHQDILILTGRKRKLDGRLYMQQLLSIIDHAVIPHPKQGVVITVKLVIFV